MFKSLKKALTVPLKINWSTILLPVIIIWSLGWSLGIFMSCVLIASVLAHEYAHVWVAQREDLQVGGVVLMAIGAAAMIELDDNNFYKELKVSLAGPACSLLFALAFFVPTLLSPFGTLPFVVFGNIFIVNLALGLFNLLPLYPMDGGRATNALLSMKFGAAKGVKISSTITYILAGAGLATCLYYRLYWMATVSVIIVLFAINQKKVVLSRNK